MMHSKIRVRGLGFILVSCLVFMGCTKQYQATLATCREERDGLAIRVDELKNNNDDLHVEVVSLEQQVFHMEKKIKIWEMQVASLLKYQQTIEEKLKKMGVDKEKLAAAFSDAEKTLVAQKGLIGELEKKQQAAQQRVTDLKQILAKFKTLIEGGKLKVKIRKGKMVLEMPNKILFDSGKAELNQQGLETLKEVAIALKGIKNREFQVAGHTDNEPIKHGNFSSNWALSTARSVAVVENLQEMGVSPKVISASGYSQYQPTGKNDTEAGKAQNRRIEIVVVPNLNELPDLSQFEKEIQ